MASLGGRPCRSPGSDADQGAPRPCVKGTHLYGMFKNICEILNMFSQFKIMGSPYIGSQIDAFDSIKIQPSRSRRCYYHDVFVHNCRVICHYNNGSRVLDRWPCCRTVGGSKALLYIPSQAYVWCGAAPLLGKTLLEAHQKHYWRRTMAAPRCASSAKPLVIITRGAY